MSERKSWESYFMEIADQVATRATCDRKHVGAVVVKDKRILATGYNGAPAGIPHCSELGHDLILVNGKESCSRAIHAEINVVAQCAKYGIPMEGATLYVNTYPCYPCFKVLVSGGIKEVVCKAEYDYTNDPFTKALSKASKVKIKTIK